VGREGGRKRKGGREENTDRQGERPSFERFRVLVRERRIQRGGTERGVGWGGREEYRERHTCRQKEAEIEKTIETRTDTETETGTEIEIETKAETETETDTETWSETKTGTERQVRAIHVLSLSLCLTPHQVITGVLLLVRHHLSRFVKLCPHVLPQVLLASRHRRI
jgi:hypothetical protein